MLPGKVFECLHSKRFHLVEMLIADSLSHRLYHSPLQFREVEIEQRGFHMELNSKWPIAQQEIKGHFMEKIGAKVEIPECRKRA